MSPRVLALLAAFAATAIYGLNHTLAKEVMPHYVAPSGFIVVRVLGATLLFWIISLWAPKEKIEKRHYPRFLVCALCGMVINMQSFFLGLNLSTPINSSVIITISPIIVFILSAVLINERITWLRTAGILLGLGGALVLVLFGAETRADAPNIPLGNMFFLLNATAYSVYLILVKPLTQQYHAITLLKWLFLISLVGNLPLGISEFMQIDWAQMPQNVWLKVLFVVLGTTFFTYLLNIFALKELKASTLGAFIYFQPLLAIIFAVLRGADSLNFIKILATVLVFLGVWLVSRKIRKRQA